jgi:hypothetical protein
MTKSEILKALFTKYDLIFDADHPDSKDNDVYLHKHYKIITRTGIEKIQKGAGIHIRYETPYISEKMCVIKGYGWKDSSPLDVIETFGSASEETSNNKYYPEMAEKRTMSRLVLKIAGLYELGVFGQDEADDFNPNASVKTVEYKGKAFNGK